MSSQSKTDAACEGAAAPRATRRFRRNCDTAWRLLLCAPLAERRAVRDPSSRHSAITITARDPVNTAGCQKARAHPTLSSVLNTLALTLLNGTAAIVLTTFRRSPTMTRAQ